MLTAALQTLPSLNQQWNTQGTSGYCSTIVKLSRCLPGHGQSQGRPKRFAMRICIRKTSCWRLRAPRSPCTSNNPIQFLQSPLHAGQPPALPVHADAPTTPHHSNPLYFPDDIPPRHKPMDTHLHTEPPFRLLSKSQPGLRISPTPLSGINASRSSRSHQNIHHHSVHAYQIQSKIYASHFFCNSKRAQEFFPRPFQTHIICMIL